MSLAFPTVPPASFTPSHALAHVPPFNDVTDNNPCARRIISTANGVSFLAQSLCLFHLRQKLGDKDVQAPYVDAA